MKIEVRWMIDLNGKRQREEKQQKQNKSKNKTVLEENAAKLFKIEYEISNHKEEHNQQIEVH